MMLYRCERMSITAMNSICAVNRSRKVDMRCNGCSGETIIESEVGIMSTMCNYKGCKKTQVFKGFCTEHIKAEGLYEKFQAHKLLKKANQQVVEKQNEITSNPRAPFDETAIPVITQEEIKECDEIFYLKSVMADVLDSWAVSLNKAPNIKRRAELFLNMCKAGETLRELS